MTDSIIELSLIIDGETYTTHALDAEVAYGNEDMKVIVDSVLRAHLDDIAQAMMRAQRNAISEILNRDDNRTAEQQYKNNFF